MLLPRIFLMLLMLVNSSAFAEGCFSYTASYAGAVFKGSSATNVCADLVSKVQELAGKNSVSGSLVGSGPNYSCQGKIVNGSSTQDFAFPVYATEVPCDCPIGREKNSSGACVCKSGLVEDPKTNLCVPDDDSACSSYYLVNELPGGSLVQDYRYSGNVADSSQFCQPGAFDDPKKGCKVVFTRSSFYSYGDGKDVTEGHLSKPVTTKGNSCSVGDSQTPKEPPKEKCKNGYTGTVNGVEVCVNKVPDTGVNPNGTTTTTTNDGTNTTTTQTNSDTKCDKGVCTTTTTTTTTVTNNTTGTSTTNTSTGTTTENQSDYCKKNPSAKLCGGTGGGGNGDGDSGSSFTGSCKSGFQCEGDAIMCAVAREQHLNNCKLLDDSNPHPQYKAATDGSDDQSADKLKANATQISVPNNFNQAGLGWGKGCPSDPEIPLGFVNRSFSIPFSRICGPLEALSLAGVGVTLLGCMVWVVGGKKD